MTTFNPEYENIKRIRFKMLDTKLLYFLDLSTVMIGDNSMEILQIEIPRILNGIDVGEYKYTILLESRGEYFERTPFIKITKGSVFLEIIIDTELTKNQGGVKFNIKGEDISGTNRVFYSGTQSFSVKPTMRKKSINNEIVENVSEEPISTEGVDANGIIGN